MNLPFTNELKNKIKLYIKNKLDIADLIKNINIQNQDLSGAIITYFNRIQDNISNCNFARTIIGREGSITNLSGTTMINCNFKDSKWLGKVLMNGVNAKGSNFSGAFTPNWSYRNADFTGCNFCDAVIRIGTREGKGAKFDNNFMKDLSKAWAVKVVPKSIEEMKE